MKRSMSVTTPYRPSEKRLRKQAAAKTSMNALPAKRTLARIRIVEISRVSLP
jgi:hypothetical protein